MAVCVAGNNGKNLKTSSMNKRQLYKQLLTPPLQKKSADSLTVPPLGGGPLMVVMGGPPGSGKSTFCETLIKNASRPWTRICQDIIAGGKQGNRKQCLKLTKSELSCGRSVLIDRCNMEAEQRKDFLAVAAETGADAHAVFINLPLSVCIARATSRQNHEGGVEGPRAEAVVKMNLRKQQLPVFEEGFKRISVCRSDVQVADTLELYKNLTPIDSLLEGVYRTFPLQNKSTKTSSNNQPGEYFKTKVGNPSSGIKVRTLESFGFGKVKENPKGNNKLEQVLNVSNKPRETALPQREDSRRFHAVDSTDQSEKNKGNGEEVCDDNDDEEKDNEQEVQEGVSVPYGDCATPSSTNVLAPICVKSNSKQNSEMALLAFPSISTSDFKFDHEKAACVIVEVSKEFLENQQHKGLGLVLVDLSEKSSMLTKVSQKAERERLDPTRFRVFAGDITKLRSSKGPPCHVIANATNWRLKAGGGGVNAAIHVAAGPDLLRATKKRAETISPGSALAVPLSPVCPLREHEGVTHVIHVLGPNMNDMRPNCLRNDYTQGEALLRSAYHSLFTSFAEIVNDPGSEVEFGAVSASVTGSEGEREGRGEGRGEGDGDGDGEGEREAGGIPKIGGASELLITGDKTGGDKNDKTNLKGGKLQSNAFDFLMRAGKRKDAPMLHPGSSSKNKRARGEKNERGDSAHVADKGEIAQTLKTDNEREPFCSLEPSDSIRHDDKNFRPETDSGLNNDAGCSHGGTGDSNNPQFEKDKSFQKSKNCIPETAVESGQTQASKHDQTPGSSGVRHFDEDIKRKKGKEGYSLGPREDKAGPESVAHGKGSRGGQGSGVDDGSKGGRERERVGAWSDGLRVMAKHPERHLKEAVFEYDESAVVVKDLYPKARRHVLVVAREDGLDRLSQVRKQHLPLLRHMEALGTKWASTFQESDPSLHFQFGYHAEPSMKQLHLHVVSQDFDSPSLKNKKHWNSFTTAFFLPSKLVLETIEQTGAGPTLPPGEGEKLLKQELRCHRCRSVEPNIPRLKVHIKKCNIPQ